MMIGQCGTIDRALKMMDISLCVNAMSQINKLEWKIQTHKIVRTTTKKLILPVLVKEPQLFAKVLDQTITLPTMPILEPQQGEPQSPQPLYLQQDEPQRPQPSVKVDNF